MILLYLYLGGTCKDMMKTSDSEKPFECQCHARYIGFQCELDTDPCASQPCLYGGICSSSPEGKFASIV